MPKPAVKDCTVNMVAVLPVAGPAVVASSQKGHQAGMDRWRPASRHGNLPRAEGEFSLERACKSASDASDASERGYLVSDASDASDAQMQRYSYGNWLTIEPLGQTSSDWISIILLVWISPGPVENNNAGRGATADRRSAH